MEKEFGIGTVILDHNIAVDFSSLSLDISTHPNNWKYHIQSSAKLIEAIVLFENIIQVRAPERIDIELEIVTNQDFWNFFKFILPLTVKMPDPVANHSYYTSYYTYLEGFYCAKFGCSYTTVRENKIRLSEYSSYQHKALLLTTKKAKEQIKKNNEWTNQIFFSLDTPLLFNYIVQRSTSHKDMYKRAVDLRYSKEAIMFRKMSMAFEIALKSNNNDDLIFIIDEMENAISLLSKKISTPLSIPIDISFPLGFSIDTDEVLNHFPIVKKHHINFITMLYDSAIRSSGSIEKFIGFSR